MALDVEKAFDAVSELNLWFKIRGGETLTLTDISTIIPLRWSYFRDNWDAISQNYKDIIPTYSNPEALKRHIDDLTDFIRLQRKIPNSRNPFSNSDTLFRFFTIFDVTDLDGIRLSKIEENIVEDTTSRINAFTRNNFLFLRSRIALRRDNIADTVGLTDDDYNTIKERSPKPEQVSVTNKSLNEMAQLQNSIKTIDFILANIFALDVNTIDPFALARANANNPEIDIGSYASGNLVKFNQGENLQDIAGRELGDRDRWIDVAIANGLKPPYIDETGKKVPLLSNASGNQINLAPTDTDGNPLNDELFINQVVLLQSNTQPFPDQRVITSIKETAVSGELIIQLTGDNDLEKYRIDENAHIRIFKPSTINSKFLILIPSGEPLTEDSKREEPFFLRESTESEKRQGVDLQLSDSGDLVFNSTNDLQLSFGVNNAIQALKLKLSVETGELKRHPDFGLTNVVGTGNSNISSVQAILVESIETAISTDERFDRVESLDIAYFTETAEGDSATGFDVKVEVRMSGQERTIPISFSVTI